MRFRDRREAGQRLARALGEHPGAVVLAFEGPALEVAAEVAAASKAKLHALRDRPKRLAHEQRRPTLQNEALLRKMGFQSDALARLRESRQAEQKRSRPTPRRQRLPELEGQQAIIVDDGLGDPARLRKLVLRCKAAGATSVIVAAPAAGAELQALEDEAEVVYVRERVMEGPEAGVYVQEADRDHQLEILHQSRNR